MSSAKTVSVRLNKDIYYRVRALAEKQERSVTKTIHILLRAKLIELEDKIDG